MVMTRIEWLVPFTYVVVALLTPPSIGVVSDAATPVVRATTVRDAPTPEAALAAWTATIDLETLAPHDDRSRQAPAVIELDLGGAWAAGAPLPAIVDRVATYADLGSGKAGIAWSGRLLDGSQSSFVLARVDDVVAGAIWHSSLGTFNILPTGARDASGRPLSLIVDVDRSVPISCGCDHVQAHAPTPVPTPLRTGAVRDRSVTARDAVRETDERVGTAGAAPANVPCDCGENGSRVDIVIAYTAAARNQAGGTAGIEAVALASVESMNLAFANSAVEGVELHLAATALTSYTENLSGASVAEVFALQRKNDGYLDDVHPLRETHQADLVALLRSSSNPANAGIAFVNAGAADYGFSVTLWNYAVGSLVFAHEVGHNFGLTHDRANAGATYCHHAFGTTFNAAGQTYGTIMSYPGIKVPHYSNPDVTYLGSPTGIPLGAGLPCDNALGIERTRVAVANNVQSGEGFADCNANAIPDCEEIAADVSIDANSNGVPDECERRIYVNAAAPEGGDGASWATAYRALRDVIGEPRFRCDEVVEVWVAAGVYTPFRSGPDAGRSDAFWLAPHMRLLGGFAGDEVSAQQRDPVRNLTVLSGDQLGNDAATVASRVDNAFRVVGAAAGTDITAVVDGFTIRGGHADQLVNGGSSIGAGILGWAGFGDIRNCVITDNYANQGGGILVGNADISIVNCLIAENYGAPLAGTGGRGAGVLLQNELSATIVNCTIVGNFAWGANSSGAGVLVRGGSSVDIVNSVLWENESGSGAQLAIRYDNAASTGEPPSSAAVAHSILQGGQSAVYVLPSGSLAWGVGNLADDPLFIDSANGNWRVQLGSPAIDAGDANALPFGVVRDLDWLPRTVDGDGDGAALVDMGAYERAGAACAAADLDCDGDVDAADLATLLGLWSATGPAGDLDSDGVVGPADLAILLGSWS